MVREGLLEEVACELRPGKTEEANHVTTRSLLGRESSVAKAPGWEGLAYPQNCQKAGGWGRGEPGDEAEEAGRGLLGLCRGFGFYSRWDGTPWGFAVTSVQSGLEAGVKSRPEMGEAWTKVMAVERKEGSI